MNPEKIEEQKVIGFKCIGEYPGVLYKEEHMIGDSRWKGAEFYVKHPKFWKPIYGLPYKTHYLGSHNREFRKYTHGGGSSSNVWWRLGRCTDCIFFIQEAFS